jgi:hypothetical protein
MPTPDGLTITTLHGKFVEPNSTGTPLSGTLTFTPNPTVVTFPAENVIVTGTETAVLDDITGEFTIDLVSTDQASENPTGWTYSVTEKLVGQKQRSYLITLPFNNGNTVELADVTPTDAAPTYVPVVGPPGAPGLITTINGHSASSVNLTAADVNAVPTSAIGAVSGVASLDGSGKIPTAQIPSLSATYVAVTTIGAANGVAGLNASGLVTPTQLDLASATPTAIATAGSVGTATRLAREDHTHAGVNLTSVQSVGGIKTFTSGTQLLQVGVGVAPGTNRVTVVSIVDEVGLQVTQSTLTGSKPLIGTTGFDNTMVAFAARVNADTVDRLAAKTSGNLEFGPGNGARDVTLYRSAAGILNSTGQLAADAAAPTAVGHLTRKDYVDNADGLAVHLAGTETISGAKTFSTTVTINAALNITTSSLLISRTTSAALGYRTTVSGDTADRYAMDMSGKATWGPGNAVGDTNLYRGGVGQLKTDTALAVGGQLTVGTFGIYVILDWANLSTLGAFQNGATAGTKVPKARKIMFLGVEVWELSGEVNMGSWTGATFFTFTGGGSSGWAPVREHDWSLQGGSGSAAGVGTLRSYWNNAGNMGVSPTPGTLPTYINLETMRCVDPNV